MNQSDGFKKIKSGISGLDNILQGGFISGNTYLITGGPGTGKTTLGLQFLCKTALKSTKSLFISFSESTEKIKRDALDKNLDIKGVDFLDLTPSQTNTEEMNYNVFLSSEVEQSPIIESIINRITEIEPDRIYLDGVSQLKYISSDNYQFRKQILILIGFISNYESTLVLSSESSDTIKDDDLQFISDGVIELTFTGEERGLTVHKFRGSDFKKGFHSIRLTAEGMTVYPKITPEDLIKEPRAIQETMSSGVPEIDQLLHQGIEKGTTTVISGPTGTGKSTLAAQFASEAADKGEHTVIYTFEESRDSIINRCSGINIPIKEMVDQKTLSIEKINPLDYTPNQFANSVKDTVENMGTSILVLDSISGYHLSFKGTTNERTKDDEMLRNIHILAEYLKSRGVSLILINEIHDITGDFKISEHNISYIADNIIFIRYIEVKGEIRRAIGVLKKRLSGFEKTLREFDITSEGIKVGAPLNKLRGVLSGVPEFIQHNDDK